MTLKPITIFTAPSFLPNDVKSVASEPAAPAQGVPADAVEIRGYRGDELLPEDDGPGAGGGYAPDQEPVEGPGAGGGYDGDEIPADDDGPGAGGGYAPDQEPAEADGPGAGGGYLNGSSSFYGYSTGWNQPMAVFAGTADGQSSFFAPQVLSWSSSSSTIAMAAHQADSAKGDKE